MARFNCRFERFKTPFQNLFLNRRFLVANICLSSKCKQHRGIGGNPPKKSKFMHSCRKITVSTLPELTKFILENFRKLKKNILENLKKDILEN